jgi:hypothetical protein
MPKDALRSTQEVTATTIGRRSIVKCGLTAGLALGLSPVAAIAQDDHASFRPYAGDFLV